MGDFVASDYTLLREIFVGLLDQLNHDYDTSKSQEKQDYVVEFASVLLFGYLLGLRGEEIMKVDAGGFLKYLDIGAAHTQHPHVIVPLIGRLKGETGERYHMLVMSRLTKTGIPAGKWVINGKTTTIAEV